MRTQLKKQTAAALQQDYLDAFELASKYVVPGSPAKGAELFSKYAAELGEKSGVEFAELRVIAL